MRFKIDWASLIVGSKFTVFALFYFVFEGNFQVQAPGGAYIWRGNLTEGFLRYRFGELTLNLEGLIFGILQYASHNNYFPGITIPGNISGHLRFWPDFLEDPGFKTMVGQRITSGQDDYLSAQTFVCPSF